MRKNLLGRLWNEDVTNLSIKLKLNEWVIKNNLSYRIVWEETDHSFEEKFRRKAEKSVLWPVTRTASLELEWFTHVFSVPSYRASKFTPHFCNHYDSSVHSRLQQRFRTDNFIFQT